MAGKPMTVLGERRSSVLITSYILSVDDMTCEKPIPHHLYFNIAATVPFLVLR